MSTRHSRIAKLTFVAALVAAPFLGADAGPQPAPSLEQKTARVRQQMQSRITQADRERAADALKALKEKLRKAKDEAAAKLGGAAKSGTSAKPSGATTATLNATSLPPSDLPPGVVVGPLSEYPDYYTTANWAFSPPLRKFVDTLAGLGPAGANNLHNFIPVAVPDTITYPGSDYYEIELQEYPHRFHTELNPTTVRGYVQVNKGTDQATQQNTIDPPPIMYLGPTIVAERDRPVRIKFTNKLPTGAAGKLNIPVDTTVMGSGQGPAYPDGSPCDNTVEGSQCAEFPQNRAVIHLHGGRTPWISDGTPFQYLTPAGEDTPFEKGVSFFNVPDMPDPGPGATTYYYTNQQSARLMFYHDHAWGTTRLNVLVGMAAGLIITDEHERQLVRDGVLPPLDEQIPLIIQDRTFVDASDVRTTDPTWNWGSGPVDENGIRTPVTGDLWIPHVYMPAQNPYALDYSGANPFGRWVYGPWFFPPTDAILYPPIANPYHDPNCDSPIPEVFETCTAPGQPPLIPATPRPSVGMETFFDTQTVNGVAFPTTEVQPKTYRLRILNASNDRFVNLSLFEADPTQVSSDGRENTEIKMVPASAQYFDLAQYPLWPTDGREGGVPDPTKSGPPFIQIGTESGFLPRPTIVKSQPIGYFVDPTAFWVGNVKDHALLLGPAERADVIVDFSAFAGKTLILYNDAPTAFPALDPRTDFYAGAPDMSDTGGYGRLPPGETEGELQGPQVGFGPNTRTVMQIKVADAAPAPAYDFAALQQRWLPDPANNRLGVFESAQEPIIVGQKAYDGLYTNNPRFPPNWPYWGISLIQDDFLSFETVDGTLIQNLPMEPKGIHDEMGAAFDREYGRMSGNLGMTNPNPIAGRTTFTLYDFTDPATEIVFESVNPAAGDGTQIWKVSHNGVDTHPIHFHIFDVQLVNRVGWDGQLLLPDENELGWKETIRISPLMDTIVAIRPKPPALPFNVPNSVRPLNPGIPLGSTMGFTNVDWVTQNPIVPPTTNIEVSYGWEYVWHCHILSHEEMDMMRPIILNVASHEPAAPTLHVAATAEGNELTWTDPTPVNYVTREGFGDKSSEIGFEIERAEGTGEFTIIARALANATTFTDNTAVSGGDYRYRVVAYNQAGEAASSEVMVDPLRLSTTALAFGSRYLGATSSSYMVGLTNRGTQAIDLTEIGIAGTNPTDFAIASTTCGATLGVARSCYVYLTFTPTAIGARVAALRIVASSSPFPRLVNLTGTGIDPVSLNTSGLAFGTHYVGAQSSAYLVSVTNRGSVAMTGITTAIEGANAASFTVASSTCGSTLGAGGVCYVYVRFAPQALGTLSGALVINSATPATTHSVSLSGTGADPARVTPVALAFGNVYGGAVSPAQIVTVTNLSTVPLPLTGASIVDAGDFRITNTTCGAAVPAKSSCYVYVAFSPVAVGARTGFLAIGTASPSSPNVVALSGTGVDPVGLPGSLAFTSRVVGTTSSAYLVTLDNVGPVALTLASVSITGDNAADFGIVGNTCGSSVVAGGRCYVYVNFVPSSVGARSAALGFSDSSGMGPHAVPLSGTGL